MGVIKQEVFDYHLKQFPLEGDFLTPFKNGFDINWARRLKAYNTELSVYFLSPDEFMAETFGFDHEIMLAISDFPTIEPRTMQAVDKFISAEPAKGRVDQSIFFFITHDKEGRNWITTYTTRNPQSRIPVVFHIDDIFEAKSDSWHIRNVISSQLFARDLFDYQLPIDNDLYFFGRDTVVADHLDAIKRSQNRGLFGLRKTGKTSILYKLKRIIERDSIGKVLYYDCKLPAIRKLRWHNLLHLVMRDISNSYNLRLKQIKDERHASEVFFELIKKTPSNSVTCLVFDEIEYISPLSKLDVFWEHDFVPFWQTLWAAQSQVRRLSNIIAGVNPSIIEIDTIDGVQNPMFGIVRSSYLRGFDKADLRSMLHFFGKRMGLKFTYDAIDYLHERYGGHPLLTRLACSTVHSEMVSQGKKRPVDIDSKYLRESEENRDSELIFYCRHVVSELRQFYPDEYEMLEFLASGRVSDFMEIQSAPEYTRHLKSYGLVEIDETVNKPKFALPVVGRYIGAELARKQGHRLRKYVIPADNRASWVKRRADAITREIRELERFVNKNSSPEIYGASSYPEAERFVAITPCNSRDDFVQFINICNRCFVESIEMIGNNKGIPNYLWSVISQNYPDLFDSLKRIKVYRNNDLHLVLEKRVEKELEQYLNEDLEGHRINQVDEWWFVLQQCVLDALFVGVQCEINRLS